MIGAADFGQHAEYKRVGRYWVLNEDGAFTAAQYCRTLGPWNRPSGWDPYLWAALELQDLQVRGANGWSARRRRFLKPFATDANDAQPIWEQSPKRFDVLVEFSCDGGVTWTVVDPKAVDTTRCAISFTQASLTQIIPAKQLPRPPGLPEGMANNFAVAYVRGQARVRVTAAIEGDDRMYGIGEADPADPHVLPWHAVVDRREQVVYDSRMFGNSALYHEYGRDWPPARGRRTNSRAMKPRSSRCAGTKRAATSRLSEVARVPRAPSAARRAVQRRRWPR